MKKIKILSFQFDYNYGALLQAFSLQNYCKKFDDSVAHVNYIPYLYFVSPYEKTRYLHLKILVRIYKWMCRFVSAYMLGNRSWNKVIRKDFSFFLKTVSMREAKSSQVFIVGSDQVWNPNFIWGRENLYFLKNFGKKIEKIAYAASLGMAQWPKGFEKKVIPMLRTFKAISVREESSVAYLNSLGFENVFCSCDPTLLHEAGFYRKSFDLKRKLTDEIFYYHIHENCPINLEKMFHEKLKEISLRSKNNQVLVSQWLSYIDNSKFVITDSFHCVVFCLLFHKPFLVILNQSSQKGMNERFATILGKTGLEYRCLKSEDSTKDILEKLNTPIDWSCVDKILEEWREFSANWLKQALES